MGDWNTLHLFDSKKFYKTIVPDLKGDGEILQYYFNSTLGKSILWDNIRNRDLRIENILKLCKGFDADFKAHSVYKLAPVQDTFINVHIEAIEDINRIIQLIIFSECSLFSPYFKLGKRLINYFIDIEKMGQSIASEYLDLIRFRELDSLHSCIGNGIVNWLTHDEVTLFLGDYSHIIPKETEEYSGIYLSELKSFLQIASDNNLGVISMTNIDETSLGLIEDIPIKLNIGKQNRENFISRK